jgi:hypothetical protein
LTLHGILNNRPDKDNNGNYSYSTMTLKNSIFLNQKKKKKKERKKERYSEMSSLIEQHISNYKEAFFVCTANADLLGFKAKVIIIGEQLS